MQNLLKIKWIDRAFEFQNDYYSLAMEDKNTGLRIHFALKEKPMIYFDLGIIAIKGILFKFDKSKVSDNILKSNKEFNLGSNYVCTAIDYFVPYPSDHFSIKEVDEMVYNRFIHVLNFYTLSSLGHIWMKKDNIVLWRWMPCFRTCNQLLVRLQRCFKQQRQSKRLLAFVMAINPRLGKESKANRLDLDTIKLVCGYL